MGNCDWKRLEPNTLHSLSSQGRVKSHPNDRHWQNLEKIIR